MNGMNVLPANIDELVIRLAPGVSFGNAADGRPVAEICRGQATTRFAIDHPIQAFLECFRTPRTLRQAAAALSDDGFKPDNVIAFGKQLLKTPLLEFHDESLPIPAAEDILDAVGLRLVTANKDRSFDGVYHVKDRSGIEWIAKLLRGPLELGASQRVLKRMRNEYSVLQRLHHVSAVPRAGHFAEAPHPYFLMEFIAGETLTDYVKRHCSLERRMVVASRIIDIMAQVHAHDVIHGDLHTSNFLIEAHDTVRVIDFDCSFVRGADDVPRVGGAVHFIPPERLAQSWHSGEGVIPDLKSDIYQLGIIMYFVLSGVPPYRGLQYAELAAAVRKGSYAPLRSTREGEQIPQAICEAVHACMASRPEERPASLDQIHPIFQLLHMEPATR